MAVGSPKGSPVTRVLGPIGLAAFDRSETIHHLSGQAAAAVALLVTRHPGSVSSQSLIDTLWSQTPPASAGSAVRNVVARLRTSFDEAGYPDAIERTELGYRLTLDEPVSDLSVFLTSVETAERLATADASQALEVAESALSWWRGKPYENVALFGDLVVDAAVADERLADVSELIVDLRCQLGDVGSATTLALRNLTNSPYRERRWRQLMVAQAMAGHDREALQTAQRARRLFADDLGLDVSSLLGELEQRILNHEPLLPGVEQASPLKPPSYDNSGERPSSWPAVLSSFIGRGAEVEHLASLVKSRRLVTMRGPAGIGKTRLALEVLGSFDVATRSVTLSAVQPGGVREALAMELGLRSDSTAVDEQLIASTFGPGPFVLLLDNAEHVVSEVRHFAEQLLAFAPELHILVTSRVSLNSSVDYEFLLTPMLPNEALALLKERLGQRALAVDDESGQRVVRHLEGIPLSIELAAQQLRVLGVDELISDGASPILDESIARSYALLSEHARLVYRAACTTSGPVTAADAAALAGLTRSVADSALKELVESSMIAADRGPTVVRFRLLDSLRRFGTGRVTEPAEAARFRIRHAQHYAAQMARAEPALRSQLEVSAAGQVESFVSELSTALDTLVEERDLDRAVALACDVGDYAFFRLRYDLYDAPTRVLAVPDIENHTRYGELLGAASGTSWIVSRYDEAADFAQRALAVAEERNESPPITACQTLVVVCGNTGDIENGARHAARFIELAEQTEDWFRLTNAYVLASIGLTVLGGTGAAIDFARLAVDVADKSGNHSSKSWARYAVALALAEEDPAASRAFVEESIRLADEAINPLNVSISRTLYAAILRRSGQLPEAAQAIALANDLWWRSRNPGMLSRALCESGLILAEIGQSDVAMLAMAAAEALPEAAPPIPADRPLIDARHQQFGIAPDLPRLRVPDRSLIDQVGAALRTLHG